jgi:hypothetical protein
MDKDEIEPDKLSCRTIRIGLPPTSADSKDSFIHDDDDFHFPFCILIFFGVNTD